MFPWLRNARRTYYYYYTHIYMEAYAYTQKYIYIYIGYTHNASAIENVEKHPPAVSLDVALSPDVFLFSPQHWPDLNDPPFF